MEFRCFDCQKNFEAEGGKIDYTDPMYGPCSKTIAACPDCGSECREYRRPKLSKVSGEPENSCPSYHNGTCSCCH